jgi:hypothetical protein
MTISVRQEWPSAWTAASGTAVASGNAGSACLLGSAIGALVIWDGGAGSTPPSSVVDSASQAYTASGAVVTDTNTGLNLALYRFMNNASATALAATATWASATTFRGIWPFEIAQVTSTGYQLTAGQSQDSPGTGTGAISSGPTGTLSAQPCLLHVLFFDATANALSVVAGGLTAGTTGLLLSGNSFASGVSGNLRLTATTSVSATATNTTDGAGASFLTLASVWTELGSTNSAVIAWAG